jgi:nucleotide-binding universal stress UspA family protein
MDEANRRGLKATLAEVPNDVQADSHYYVGDPASELVRRSAEHDLLVLGSRGYGPVRSVLLGSVSSFVVRTAATAVLVVPRVAQTEEHSNDEWQPSASILV